MNIKKKLFQVFIGNVGLFPKVRFRYKTLPIATGIFQASRTQSGIPATGHTGRASCQVHRYAPA